MSRSPQPQVRCTLPIGGIVTGIPSVAGKVGNLVMFIPGSNQAVNQFVEHLQRQLFVTLLHQPSFAHAPQGRALLVNEIVGRDMRHTQGQSLSQIGSPPLDCLARQAINEVDAEVVVSGCKTTFHRLDRRTGRMAPMQEGQVGIGETLHPHAQPIDRCIFQRSDKLGGHIVGVGFVGHLATSLPINTLRKCLEQLFTLGRHKCRGCTSSEIECLDRLTAQLVATHRPLPTDGIDIASPPRRIGRRKKVAIDAAACAKRNVNIDSCHRAAKVVNVAGKTGPSPEFFLSRLSLLFPTLEKHGRGDRRHTGSFGLGNNLILETRLREASARNKSCQPIFKQCFVT